MSERQPARCLQLAGRRPGEFCLACQSNVIIPDLSVPGNHLRWKEIELAKRRLFYSLLSLELTRHLMPQAIPTLQFEFKASVVGERSLPDRNEGLITLDIAETEDTTRVQRRAYLGRTIEPCWSLAP